MMPALRYALKSLLRRPAVATLLAVGLAVALGLPAATRAVVAAFGEELRSRAAAAPLVLGAAGSGTDLVLHALYFHAEPPGSLTVADGDELGSQSSADGSRLAETVPLLVRGTARGVPVVGTDGGYFRWRGLTLAAGGPLERMGQCVAGADAAAALGLRPGDPLATDPDTLFGPSGGVPVRLRTVGVLNRTGTADDDAIFVRLETAWLVAGLGHAHANPAARHDGDAAPNAAGGGFIEVTDENAGRFHFHGRPERFPLSAVIAVPRDEPARLLLVARYLDRPGVRLVESDRVLNGLLATAVRLRRLFDATAAVTAAGTLTLCTAVTVLVLRLRRDELRTLHRLGVSRPRVTALFAFEFLLIAAVAALLATGLALAASAAGPWLLRWAVG